MHNFILTIDSGNTNTSCILFDKSQKIITQFDFSKIKTIISDYNLDNKNTYALLSSVTNKTLECSLVLNDIKKYFEGGYFFKMPVHYNESLGIDRLVISYPLFKDSNRSYLVIDSGTFTTADFVDLKGFNGGYILPGLSTLFEAYNKGAKLYAPKPGPMLSSIPQTTHDALNQGALLSFISPIIEIINNKRINNIIVTGGDGKYLADIIEKRLNKKEDHYKDISIHFEKNLIHNSLFKIAKILMD